VRPGQLAEIVAAHRERILASHRGGDGAEPWASVRSAYGVPVSAREQELEACLDAVVAWARESLPGLAPGAPGEPDAASLDAHLAGLVAETRRELSPPTSGAGGVAGLGAIFANATANVGWWQERFRQVKEVSVIRCRTCGSRQEQALVFACAYCGREMFGDPKDPEGETW